MPTTTIDAPTPSLDHEGVMAFAGQVRGDIAAAAGVAMLELGDRLGLFRAMHGAGPVDAATVAVATGCHERLVQEWLYCQSAAGYVTYDPDARAFELTPLQAAVVAVEGTPAFVVGASQIVRTFFLDGDRLEAAFRGDGSLAWHDHSHDLYDGADRFLSGAHAKQFVDAWVPNTPGLVDTLTDGARVLDVGCGGGVALVNLALAFPSSTFVGVDAHAEAITKAGRRAAEAGVQDRVHFEVADAVTGLPDGEFDLVCFLEVLHDLGDPDGALRAAAEVLAPGGLLMAAEINAPDTRVEQLQEPAARMHFAASTALCTPNALSQPGPVALGNQVGFARWAEIFAENGYRDVTEVDRDPVMMVVTARR